MFPVVGCWSKEEFEDKSMTHFITYFKRQDERFLKCDLHAMNNACNRLIFTENNMIKVKWSLQYGCVNTGHEQLFCMQYLATVKSIDIV
eukprot:3058275-Ditylum_brightwellii.AAC.1